MIIVEKENLKFQFTNKGDFNKFAFLEICKKDKSKSPFSKKDIEIISLFDLLNEYGYDYVSLAIDLGILPVDKNLLWSDEKAMALKLFKFEDEDKWFLLDQEYNSHVFFTKFESLLPDYKITVLH